MKEVLKLLREALPEAVGGLLVAAVLALIGALYADLGVWGSVLLAVIGVVIIGICLRVFVARRKRAAGPPAEERNMGKVATHAEALRPRPTILYVEDEADMLDLLSATLKLLASVDLVMATSVEQAVRVLESEQPLDLVIIDLGIPPYDGYDGKIEAGMGFRVCEVARNLRGNIPIAIYSAVRESDISAEIERFNIAAFLNKPLDPLEVVEHIKLILVRARSPSKEHLVRREIERRKIELMSAYPSDRLRALWALGQIGHLDSALLTKLDEMAAGNGDQQVRMAAREAAESIRCKLRQEEGAS
jgi:CheY-like chemotaxis protein